MIPARTCSRVLFPAPFGPITASDSPWTSRNVTFRRAQKWVGPVGRRARFLNESRMVVLRVRRRLYRTPRLTASMAYPGSLDDGMSENLRERRLEPLEDVDPDQQEDERCRGQDSEPRPVRRLLVVDEAPIRLEESRERVEVERQVEEPALVGEVLDLIERIERRREVEDEPEQVPDDVADVPVEDVRRREEHRGREREQELHRGDDRNEDD